MRCAFCDATPSLVCRSVRLRRARYPSRCMGVYGRRVRFVCDAYTQRESRSFVRRADCRRRRIARYWFHYSAQPTEATENIAHECDANVFINRVDCSSNSGNISRQFARPRLTLSTGCSVSSSRGSVWIFKLEILDPQSTRTTAMKQWLMNEWFFEFLFFYSLYEKGLKGFYNDGLDNDIGTAYQFGCPTSFSDHVEGVLACCLGMLMKLSGIIDLESTFLFYLDWYPLGNLFACLDLSRTRLRNRRIYG